MPNYAIKSLEHLFLRWVLFRRVVTAQAPEVGLRFRVGADDAMGHRIYKRGIIEADHTKFLLENLRLTDGDVVLDVGANIGWYALVLDRKFDADIRIFAFEPEEVNHGLLVENMRLNAARHVVPVRKAVSDWSGVATLHLYEPKNTGRHSLLPLPLNEGGEMQVETTTLDDFLAQQGIAPAKVKFMKVDIEGYEQVALQGARSILGVVPLVLIEYTPKYQRQVGIDPTKLLDSMYARGYAPRVVRDGALAPVARSEIYGVQHNTDFFWVLEA